MATTIILEAIAKVNADPAQKSIATLEQELEFLKERFKGLSVGDTEFTKIGNRIREVQSELKTLDERFEGLGAEQKATAIAESFNVVVGAVGAVTGALVAFGVESKALEGVEKRLLGIITVVTSLREVSNGLVAFQKVWPILTANIARATVALRAFALANPFTTILIAITAVTAAIYGLIKAQDDEIDTAKQLNDEYKKQQQNLKDLKDVRDKVLAAQGETEVERLTRLKAENEQELKNARDRVEFYKQQKFQGEDLNNQLKIIREAKLQQPVLEAQLAAANKEANEKIRAENKKTAEESAKQNADAIKAAEDLRLARLKAAQEGAEGLIKIETDVRTAVLNKFLELNQKLIDDYEFFPLDEENILLLQESLKDIEFTTREIRLRELDKTTSELLKANEEYFAKIIEGVEIGGEQYIQAEKQFQDNIIKITEFYNVEKQRIERENSDEIFDINNKARAIITKLAFDQGEELLKIEGATYAELKKGVIDYYDTVIAAAKAAGIATVELENQKAKLLSNIDDQRRKDIEEGIRNTLSGLSSFLSQQRDIIDSQLQADLIALGNNEVAKNALRERAFEQQKKLRIAEATISGLTGAVDAFNSVQNLNKLIPGLGIAVGLGLAGTVAAITAQQIALIANSSFNNPSVSGVGFNNVPAGGGFSLPGGGGVSTTPSIGAGLPGLGGGRVATTGIGTIGVGPEPIRAYVLTGDIATGLGAQTALNARRRLSSG